PLCPLESRQLKSSGSIRPVSLFTPLTLAAGTARFPALGARLFSCGGRQPVRQGLADSRRADPAAARGAGPRFVLPRRQCFCPTIPRGAPPGIFSRSAAHSRDPRTQGPGERATGPRNLAGLGPNRDRSGCPTALLPGVGNSSARGEVAARRCDQRAI